jgi:signal peptidase I
MQKYRTYLVAGMLAIIMTMFIAPEIHEGNAMSPTLLNGDVVILTKETYSQNRGMPVVGELVVLSKQAYGSDYPEDNPIRRVTGVSGDTIKLEDGTKIKVEANYVFVSAENSGEEAYGGNSENGLIKSSEIKGKVILRIWPFNSIGGF